MRNETLSILDNAFASTAPGSEDRLEAVSAVAYGAMFACNDEAVSYIWQAVVGLCDLEYRGELAARVMVLAGECAQYVQDAREATGK